MKLLSIVTLFFGVAVAAPKYAAEQITGAKENKEVFTGHYDEYDCSRACGGCGYDHYKRETTETNATATDSNLVEREEVDGDGYGHHERDAADVSATATDTNLAKREEHSGSAYDRIYERDENNIDKGHGAEIEKRGIWGGRYGWGGYGGGEYGGGGYDYGRGYGYGGGFGYRRGGHRRHGYGRGW